MRTQLKWLPVVIAAVMLGAWNKPLREMMTPEKTVTKNVSLAVYRADNYNASVYAGASASLQVSIVKVRGNERTVVWQKAYDARLLRDYPMLQNAMAQNITVKNVVDSKDKLEVVYTLTYDAKGSQLQLQNGTIISKGEKDGKLFINI
ncbi:MAG TPA: hypothetical protein VG738_02580 [Chitinophagaceae bacterium]|nr:hypothetical protein [Chitinophagaceae bacterium]